MIAIRYLESYQDATRGTRDDSAEAYIKDARSAIEREQRRQKKSQHRRARRVRNESIQVMLAVALLVPASVSALRTDDRCDESKLSDDDGRCKSTSGDHSGDDDKRCQSDGCGESGCGESGRPTIQTKPPRHKARRSASIRSKRTSTSQLFRITEGLVVEGQMQNPLHFTFFAALPFPYDYAELRKSFLPKLAPP